MTHQELTKLLCYLETIPEKNTKLKATELVLDVAKGSIKQELVQKTTSKVKEVIVEENGRCYLKLTKKEIDSMPNNLNKILKADDKMISYRFHRGMHHARYRRDGFNIEVASTSLKIMKEKLMAKLRQAEEDMLKNQFPKFDAFSKSWLKIKKQLIKEVTYVSYERQVNTYLLPVFGEKFVHQITRQELQDFLFSFTEQGKFRTAQKLKQVLCSMFEMICEDYPTVNNPTRKLVLGHYETDKGKALTKDEEAKVVDYIKKNPNCSTNSSILVMLYTGMRIGELKTLNFEGDFITCVTGKSRKGHKEVTRYIPISPMMKKVLPLIDFDLAKNSKGDTIRLGFKKIFPKRHCHEFRYTFITRAKECGCNQEAVMLWAGHEFDKDVVTSRVDRGYTTYSKEYFLEEVKKIDYDLPKIS